MPDTVALDYRQHGDSAQPTLVLLHGLYGSASNWARIVSTLAQDYRVLSPDLRNHGGSPQHADMRYPAMAADVLALLDSLDIEKAHILGHSMGGKVAMLCALQSPQRLHSLIVADMAPRAYADGEHQAIIDAMRELDLTALDSRRAADQALAAAIPVQGVRQFLLTNLQRRQEHWCWRLPLDILSDQLPVIMDWPTVEGRFNGPALFLHGGRSDYLSSPDHAVIQRLFPKAHIRCLENRGHWLHAEDPAAFSEEVMQFLDDTNNSAM